MSGYQPIPQYAPTELRERLESDNPPFLLDVQTDSFEWLIGSQGWRERALERGPTNGNCVRWTIRQKSH